MATTFAVKESVISSADAPKPPLSHIYEAGAPSTKKSIWTRVSRVRQLLTPSKAPSNHPSLASPESLFAHRTTILTEGSQSHYKGQDSPRDSGYASFDPPGQSAQGRESLSALAFAYEPSTNGDIQQEVASDHRSTKTTTRSRISSADTGHVESGQKFTPTRSLGASDGPGNGGAPSLAASLDVDPCRSMNGLVEAIFNERSAEKLSHQLFVDKRLAIPDAVVQVWNRQVKGKLDEDLQHIIGGMSAGTDHIFSETQLYMAGVKRGGILLVEPTIIITCGSKLFRKRIERHLSRLRLHYLNDFGYPISVRYQPAPAYWTSSSVGSSIDATQSGVSNFGFSNLQRLWIEHTWPSTACGLKMKYDLVRNRQTQQCYATLGGIVRIDNVIYGLTTAHTFLAGLENAVDLSAAREVDSTSSDYGSDIESESIFTRRSSGSFPHSDIDFKLLWNPKLPYPSAFSFLGRAKREVGVVTRQVGPRSDWALFSVPYSCVLPNMNATSELQSVTPEVELVCGDVSILCGPDARCKGFLTQSSTSLHTGTTIIEVREILLDVVLAGGASGAWVVRGVDVCGYVIAATGRGHSCFMVPMERAFKDIEAVLGKPVTLGHRPRKAGSFVDNYHTLMQSPAKDTSLKTPPVPLQTGVKMDESKIHPNVGALLPDAVDCPDSLSMYNVEALAPHSTVEDAEQLQCRYTTVEVLEMSAVCRRTADLVLGVMRKHKYAAVTLTSLHRTLRTSQSMLRGIAIDYHERDMVELRAHDHPSMQELRRYLVALKEIMNTLNEEFIPFLNFAPYLDDTVGFTRLPRIVWKIRGYQTRIQAYTIVIFAWPRVIIRQSIKSERIKKEAGRQVLPPQTNIMDEDDLVWEEETRILWSHPTFMNPISQPDELSKVQHGLSNISIYTLMASKKSTFTADTDSSINTQKDLDVLYQPLGFEDLLFASEVYMRNHIRPDVTQHAVYAT